MERKREQAELIFKLGLLLGPLLKIADKKNNYDREELVLAVARFFNERPKLDEAVGHFAKSEPGHNFFPQNTRIMRLLNQIQNAATDNPDDEEALFSVIREVKPQVLSTILSIPVTSESTIHQAQTPFSTYCLVKNLCLTSSEQIVWFDRYFDHKVFYRFLDDVNLNVLITLVTYPEHKLISKRDKDQHAKFIDISQLFAKERGPKGYRLLVNERFHDRWLRCDKEMFMLGGSIKDIGQEITFTISKLDTTPENEKKFDEPIQQGTELFGSNQSTHL